jgi:hypothetical protein
MAQAREPARPATAKRSRTGNLRGASDATTGQVLLLRSGEDVAEAPVSKSSFKGVAHRKRVLGKMISSYAEAAAKAKRTGKAVIITYVVTPDGKAETVTGAPAETAAGGPLDAAIARAKARGAPKVADILKGDDMLTARAFGPLIDVSHETVNLKRKRHEVLGLQGSKRGLKYPSWQVTADGRELPGLPQVFEVLGDQPWTVYRFLRANHAQLGGQTAVDALKAGQIEAVVNAAKNQAAGVFS